MTQSRRSLFSILLGFIPFLGKAIAAPAPKLAKSVDILKSFDARDWAKHFVDHVRANPNIPLDEETMVGWFANALMRGYDECRWKHPEYVTYPCGCKAGPIRYDQDPLPPYCPDHGSREAIADAISKTWLKGDNKHKVGWDLATAIADGVHEKMSGGNRA